VDVRCDELARSGVAGLAITDPAGRQVKMATKVRTGNCLVYFCVVEIESVQ
jgi:hypothetical protein